MIKTAKKLGKFNLLNLSITIGIIILFIYLLHTFINSFLLFSNFEIKNGVVNHVTTSVLSKISEPIPNADPKTFKPYSSSSVYAKDKNNIYFNASIVSNADLATFRPLNENETKAATEETAKYYAKYYAKDNNNIYYQGKVINSRNLVDVESFSLLNSLNYVKDKNRVYYMYNRDNINENSNSKTSFKYEVIPVLEINPTNITFIKNTKGLKLGFDNSNHFWKQVKIPKYIDTNSLELVNEYTRTFKDSTNVYCFLENYDIKILNNVNTSNFKQDLSNKNINFNIDKPLGHIMFTDGQKYFNGYCEEL